MGSRNGTWRDAEFPIRPGTVCKGLKTQASQIPKRCGTSWEAVGIVFSSDSRSEEHTSELQSRLHLVCRLLLEKKKKKKYNITRNRLSIHTLHTNSSIR